MFRKIEKYAFQTPSFRISKELRSSLRDLLKERDLNCILRSETTDIETDDINLFLGSEWPPNISLIQIKTLGSDEKVEIIFNFRKNGKIKGGVLVSGNDSIWVKGMGSELQKLFEKHKLWFSPIAGSWKIRLLMSMIIVFFVVWQLNRRLLNAGIQTMIGFTELQLFIFLLLLSTVFLHPLNLAIAWLFPRFEFTDSHQKGVRRIFWSLLVLLIGWVITEFLFPQLLPVS